jgi:hypothetical protein
MSKIASKWMIVIVERHVLWSLWCIDFAGKAAKEKQDIVILDLSRFRVRRHKNNSKYFLTKFYRKNRIENIINRVTLEQKIEVISPNFLDYFGWTRGMFHRSNLVSFVNGLDSEYFQEKGARIVNESQLKPKIRAHAILIYNKVFKITTEMITERGITKVIVPGGRSLIPNAIIAGTKSMGVECTVLEQITSKSTRYFEFPLDFRQNLEPQQLEIDKTWANGGDSKYEIAQNYIGNKLYGSQWGRNYSLKFDSSIEILKPEDKKVAAIFVGSGFEMVPSDIDIKDTDIGSNQQKRILQVFIKIALENDFSVVLRGHPSSPGLEEMYAAEDKEWAEFCDKNNVIHFSSLSKVDSYKLMKTSSINVVYGSTAGIDSIILGANTLVLANTDWAHLVPELCAFDEQSICNRFRTFERIVDVKRIYPYAYYMECGGIELSNVEYLPGGGMYFEGQEIGAPRSNFLRRILKR